MLRTSAGQKKSRIWFEAWLNFEERKRTGNGCCVHRDHRNLHSCLINLQSLATGTSLTSSSVHLLPDVLAFNYADTELDYEGDNVPLAFHRHSRADVMRDARADDTPTPGKDLLVSDGPTEEEPTSSKKSSLPSQVSPCFIKLNPDR